jgi:hypothetical protein
MNRQDSLRPVTRRALRIRYYSPATCFLPGDAYSGTSSDDASSIIDFVPTTRLAGPVLTVSNYTDFQLRLSWTSVTGADYYQVFRSTNPDGPFEFLFGPVSDLFYVDTPPAPGIYYYQVTAIEPNAGQTEPSNTGSGEIADLEPDLETPPIPGYVLWLAPESEMATDAAGTSVVTAEDSQIEFWQDLSGNENHAVMEQGIGLAGPLIKTAALNGLRGLRFGEAPGGSQFRTGLLTGSNVDLVNGITIFCVGGFRSPPSGAEQSAQFVAHGDTDFLLRASPFVTNEFSAYHESGGTQIISGVNRGYSDYLQTLRFDDAGNTLTLWVNGAVAASSPDGGLLPPNGPVAIGYRTDTGVQCHLNGQIYEVIVYPTALSDSDRAAVETYLTEKYAL